MIDTNKYGLADLTSEELMLTNGGEAGDFAKIIGKVIGAGIAVLEYIGKNIAEGNEQLPTYAQGMK